MITGNWILSVSRYGRIAGWARKPTDKEVEKALNKWAVLTPPGNFEASLDYRNTRRHSWSVEVSYE